MALDARTRSSIYQKLIPVLGEQDANDLMSEFPASEADELVTKQFLRAELATQIGSLRSELWAEIGSLRTESGSLRAELASQIGSLRTEIANLENRLTLRLGGAIAAATAVLAATISLQ